MELFEYARAEDTVSNEMSRTYDKQNQVDAANERLRVAQEKLLVPLSDEAEDDLHKSEIDAFFRSSMVHFGYLKVDEEKAD